MNTADELLLLAKANKRFLLKHFFSRTYYTPEELKTFSDYKLKALFFLSIERPAELSCSLRTFFFTLENIINNPSYKHYSIPKKKGGVREIYAPSENLKSIQKRLNNFLQAYYLCIKPNEVHGFVINPGYTKTYCNIVDNAINHTNKKHVLNIDLKDFFPSILARRVKNLFISGYFNFNEQIANALTLLTTFEGKLPIGAPTSPVLSNFICLQLDSDLKIFCTKNNLVYSRYADDLTFSSNYQISTDIILDVILLIQKNNFKINEKKLRLKPSCRKQTVTGLVVNKKVNIDRKLLKKIRAMLHDFTTNGLEMATKRHFNLKSEIDEKHKTKFVNRLDGYINFVGQVRGKKDQLYIKQKSSFDNLVTREERIQYAQK